MSSPCCAHTTFDGAGVTPTHKLIPGAQPDVVVLGILDVVVVAVVVEQFGPGWQAKHPLSFHSYREVPAIKPAFSRVTVEKEHAPPETTLLWNAKALQLGS